MVQIGTIEYEAKVSNVAEAQANANELVESQNEVATSAERAGGSAGFFAGMMTTAGDATGEAKDEADDADTSFTLLSGTTFLLTSAMSRLIGVVTGGSIFGAVTSGAAKLYGILSGLTLSGVLGSVTSAVSGFVSWLAAGSAGAWPSPGR